MIITEIPTYIWSLLLCALTFFVTPVANSVPYEAISKEGKKTKKYVLKHIKSLLEYGGYKTGEEFVETAYFVTDKEGEELEKGLLRSTVDYKKLENESGVFYVW